MCNRWEERERRYWLWWFKNRLRRNRESPRMSKSNHNQPRVSFRQSNNLIITSDLIFSKDQKKQGPYDQTDLLEQLISYWVEKGFRPSWSRKEWCCTWVNIQHNPDTRYRNLLLFLNPFSLLGWHGPHRDTPLERIIPANLWRIWM